MVIKRVLFANFIISLFTLNNCGKCPPQEVLSPCICSSTTITCGGDQTLKLKRIFRDISLNLQSKDDKTFKTFNLNNTAITELEDSLFHDITFESIILKTTSLKRISSYVFSHYCIDTIIKLEATGSSILLDYHDISDFFIAMSSLINIRQIDFYDTHLAAIPEQAFNFTNGLQNNLERVFFYYNQIRSVSNNAFYYLNNLTYIGLDHNQISRISIHAFDFWKKSENFLLIGLNNNTLNDTSIERGAFTNAKRPLIIYLQNNSLTTLDEKIFGPILVVDTRNKLYTLGNPFVCDCRMYWLFKERNSYQIQMADTLKCKNDKLFWSLTASDFTNCDD